MKENLIIWIVFISLGVVLQFYRKKKKEKIAREQLNKFLRSLNKEKMMQDMRLVSFTNQMNEGAPITLTFFSEGSAEPLQQHHYLPAQDGGKLPFFVAGTMNIECNGKKISFDIADATKEYSVVIAADGNLAISLSSKSN